MELEVFFTVGHSTRVAIKIYIGRTHSLTLMGSILKGVCVRGRVKRETKILIQVDK